MTKRDQINVLQSELDTANEINAIYLSRIKELESYLVDVAAEYCATADNKLRDVQNVFDELLYNLLNIYPDQPIDEVYDKFNSQDIRGKK